MLNPRARAEPASIGLTVECSNAELRIVNVLGAISASIRSISGHWRRPIAQLDRVTDFYSVGCRFESCWDRH